ncbi:MAG: hypothetical protein Fur0037_27130 [Planctomycetota bacterium]
MIPPMIRLPAVMFAAAMLAAQQVPSARTLDDVARAFRAQWEALNSPERASRDEQRKLLSRQADELRAFLEHEARGDDRWNGRLMMADLRMGLSDREGALQALASIDQEAAPALILLAAADIAAHLARSDLRNTLLDAALAKEAPPEDRLAMARLLLTSLREVEKGEQIFAKALADAKDDEARAFVRWHHADATRDREDLPEDAYYRELEQLAEDLPGTYWGGIARDRCLASRFKVGGDPIPFRARATDGSTVSLEALRGRAVLLVFWASDDPSSARLVATLLELKRANADDLAIVGIARDQDPAALAERCTRLGADWPEICDGHGFRSDLFLRYQVETVPTILVIDKEGKIAALNLHTETKDALDDLTDAIARARRN